MATERTLVLLKPDAVRRGISYPFCFANRD